MSGTREGWEKASAKIQRNAAAALTQWGRAKTAECERLLEETRLLRAERDALKLEVERLRGALNMILAADEAKRLRALARRKAGAK